MSNTVDGVWNGKKISLKTEFGGHTFTDEEVTNLFNGEMIQFEATAKSGNTYIAKGKIAEYEYNGNTIIGFKLSTNNDDDVEKFEGVWKDHPVSIKREWGGHRFTDEEVRLLLDNKTIEFNALSKNGNPYKVKGKLDTQEYNGRQFIGFKADFDNKTDDTEKFEGVWNGKTVKFKRNWGGHHFSNEECQKLLSGDVIEFNATSSKGTNYIARGALAEQEFNGNKFVGFKLNFNG